MAAPVTGTYTRYTAKGLRESLSDVIYDISPTKTPFVSMCDRVSADQTLVEWQTESLAAVDTANAQVEGFEAEFTTPAATVRVGNYTQIMAKTLILSKTLERVDKAGRKSEINKQVMKRGKEIKRDLEAISLIAQGADAGGEATARKFAALNAWVKTNTNVGTSGGDPAYTSGVPGAARTDGTQRALTETIMKDVIQQCWNEGAEPSVVMVGPVNKQRISGFAGIATRNFDLSNTSPKPTAIIAAADVYVSDFGVLRVVPNRFQRERDAWFLDPEYLQIATLRGYEVEKLAKTGDAEKRLMVMEATLKILQESALGLAADLTTT